MKKGARITNIPIRVNLRNLRTKYFPRASAQSMLLNLSQQHKSPTDLLSSSACYGLRKVAGCEIIGARRTGTALVHSIPSQCWIVALEKHATPAVENQKMILLNRFEYGSENIIFPIIIGGDDIGKKDLAANFYSD